MLTLNGERFASGRSRFLDHHPRFPEPTAKVFVKVVFTGLDKTWIAQVDTGAAYSILEFEAAKTLGLFEMEGEWTRVSTRLGLLSGRLIRLPMILMADEGRSLDVEATVFVSENWRGGTFLGYSGLLDRLRIALDSPANLFYFGRES
jgi:hypothetical protein